MRVQSFSSVVTIGERNTPRRDENVSFLFAPIQRVDIFLDWKLIYEQNIYVQLKQQNFLFEKRNYVGEPKLRRLKINKKSRNFIWTTGTKGAGQHLA